MHRISHIIWLIFPYKCIEHPAECHQSTTPVHKKKSGGETQPQRLWWVGRLSLRLRQIATVRSCQVFCGPHWKKELAWTGPGLWFLKPQTSVAGEVAVLKYTLPRFVQVGRSEACCKFQLNIFPQLVCWSDIQNLEALRMPCSSKKQPPICKRYYYCWYYYYHYYCCYHCYHCYDCYYCCW